MALKLPCFHDVNTYEYRRQRLFSTIGNLYIKNLHYIVLVIALERFHIATQLRSPFSTETGFYKIFNIFYIKN